MDSDLFNNAVIHFLAVSGVHSKQNQLRDGNELSPVTTALISASLGTCPVIRLPYAGFQQYRLL